MRKQYVKRCLRCGFRWRAWKAFPRTCAKCRSPRWFTPPPAAIEDLKRELSRVRVECSRLKGRIRQLEFELAQERDVRSREAEDLKRRGLELNRQSEEQDRRKARLNAEEQALRKARQDLETKRSQDYALGSSALAVVQQTPEQRAERYLEQAPVEVMGGLLLD